MGHSSPPRKLSSSQIATAAKSFAAAQFALSGFDVLEQATSQSRFYYDLCVARTGGMMKVSIHASLNGFWDLVDHYMKSSSASATAAEYHRAIDHWLEHHSEAVTCCLVEFESNDLRRVPQTYLASPAEVAAKLHEKIDQLSHADFVPRGLDVVHRMETLPQSWLFSQRRISELMDIPAEETSLPQQIAVPLNTGDFGGMIHAVSAKPGPLMN